MISRKAIYGASMACLLMAINAKAMTYPMPETGNDIIGEVYSVKALAGETPGSLGLRYDMSLHEILEANPQLHEGQKLGAGQKVIIPAQFILPKYRKGIVVNVAELRLYYFTPDGKYVMTYPVAMGRDQWRTPTIQTKVLYKEKNPVWHVPESIRQWTLENGNKLLPDEVPPGPDNPLGHFALHLTADGYLIHGNNSPQSVGKYVSSGCIRMKNAAVEELFQEVKVGTPVYIVHYPTKAGWFNGVLYQQSQIPVNLTEDASELNQSSNEIAVEQAVQDRPAIINWEASTKVARDHLGIPTAIGEAATQEAQTANREKQPPLPIHIENTKISHSDEEQISDAHATNNEDDSDYYTTDISWIENNIGLQP